MDSGSLAGRTRSDTESDTSSDYEYGSEAKETPTDEGTEQVQSTYTETDTSSDTVADTSSDTADDDQGTMTETDGGTNDASGMESSTETSGGYESFDGIEEDDSAYAGSGNFTGNAFDSTTYTDQDGSDTTTDASGNLNGTDTSNDYEYHTWSHYRQDTDSVSSAGDDEPVTLTDQDYGSKTTTANPSTTYTEGTPTEQGGTTVQTSETYSLSEADPYTDVKTDNSTVATPQTTGGGGSSDGSGGQTNETTGAQTDAGKALRQDVKDQKKDSGASPNGNQAPTSTGSAVRTSSQANSSGFVAFGKPEEVEAVVTWQDKVVGIEVAIVQTGANGLQSIQDIVVGTANTALLGQAVSNPAQTALNFSIQYFVLGQTPSIPQIESTQWARDRYVGQSTLSYEAQKLALGAIFTAGFGEYLEALGIIGRVQSVTGKAASATGAQSSKLPQIVVQVSENAEPVVVPARSMIARAIGGESPRFNPALETRISAGKSSAQIQEQMDRIVIKIANRMGIPNPEDTTAFSFYADEFGQVSGGRAFAETGLIQIDSGILSPRAALNAPELAGLSLRARIQVVLTHEAEELPLLLDSGNTLLSHPETVRWGAPTSPLKISKDAYDYILRWATEGPFNQGLR